VVDTSLLERSIAVRNPAWRELERYSGPLPDQALTALDLVRELLQ
jgi:hypothetical protein